VHLGGGGQGAERRGARSGTALGCPAGALRAACCARLGAWWRGLRRFGGQDGQARRDGCRVIWPAAAAKPGRASNGVVRLCSPPTCPVARSIRWPPHSSRQPAGRGGACKAGRDTLRARSACPGRPAPHAFCTRRAPLLAPPSCLRTRGEVPDGGDAAAALHDGTVLHKHLDGRGGGAEAAVLPVGRGGVGGRGCGGPAVEQPLQPTAESHSQRRVCCEGLHRFGFGAALLLKRERAPPRAPRPGPPQTRAFVYALSSWASM
jgi:hypothetical protein